jgi:hypothetical protein
MSAVINKINTIGEVTIKFSEELINIINEEDLLL